MEILEFYPIGQSFYPGGISELEKGMIKITKTLQLKPCESSSEYYGAKIIVYENSRIDYVKDFDTVNISKNKCAFDYSRKIIPHLKNWMPAKEDEKFVNAMAQVPVRPFFLINSKENPAENISTECAYLRGMDDFTNEISDIFYKRTIANQENSYYVNFIVDSNGSMRDFSIEGGGFSEHQKQQYIKSLYRIKGKWKPRTLNGIAYSSKVRLPVRQVRDLQQENDFEKSIHRSNSSVRNLDNRSLR